MIWGLFQNNIPVFSPALTDGGIGDILYLFSAENPGLILDITEGKQVFVDADFIYLCDISCSYTMRLIPDISKLNNMAVAANSTGMIALGGGVAKHHICNANAWVRILHFWL